MYIRVSRWLLLFSALVFANDKSVRGTVVDASGARVDSAQISVVTPLGVLRSFPAPGGAFECALPEGSRLVIAAPGFAVKSIPADSAAATLVVKLDLAPVVDSVKVVGSAIDVPASEQGGSVSIIPTEEIRDRDEPLAAGLLRQTPGLALSQNGPTGSLTGLYIRGGDTEYNLVEIDGVPVNAFGGDFDFAHIPTEALDRIEIIRGPQSAVYGPYANSGVVNFVTREPQDSFNFDAVAEGGSFGERRFGLTGGGTVAGFGVVVSASQMNTDGPVANSDYRNQNVLVNVTRRWSRQELAVHGDFDSSENGVPGPWGSDPAHTFTGIDTVSRNKNNFSDYGARYQADLSDRVRVEAFGSMFLNNNGFISPYGYSANQDLRVDGEARAIVRVSKVYTVSVGAGGGIEQVRNSYITDAEFRDVPRPPPRRGRLRRESLRVRRTAVRQRRRSRGVPAHGIHPARWLFAALLSVADQRRGQSQARRDVRRGRLAPARIVRYGNPAARRLRSRLHEQPRAQTGTYAQFRRGRRAAALPPETLPGCDVLRHTVLRFDRDSWREPRAPEHLPIGQFG